MLSGQCPGRIKGVPQHVRPERNHGQRQEYSPTTRQYASRDAGLSAGRLRRARPNRKATVALVHRKRRVTTGVGTPSTSALSLYGIARRLASYADGAMTRSPKRSVSRTGAEGGRQSRRNAGALLLYTDAPSHADG